MVHTILFRKNNHAKNC